MNNAVRVSLVVLALLVAASATEGLPWPTVTPHPSSHTVLILGDSIADEAAQQAQATLEQQGLTATVVDDAAGGTNLVDPWLWGLSKDQWDNYFMDQHPEADTVVVEYVGSCGAACINSGIYGSWLWGVLWAVHAKAIIDHAHALGKTILWVDGPLIGGDFLDLSTPLVISAKIAAGVTLWDVMTAVPWTGAPGVDWWAASRDVDGNYQSVLTYDGSDHTVRMPDEVHFTSDGAVRLDVWLASAVGATWTS